MFSWPDVIAVLGFVALAILGGYLKVLPDKLVVALITAAVGYFAARTALLKLRKNDKKIADRRADEEGGVVESRADVQESGKIVVAPQNSGRIVEVGSDGSVHIGPVPGTDYKHDDPSDTPPDGVPPVDDGMEPKE